MSNTKVDLEGTLIKVGFLRVLFEGVVGRGRVETWVDCRGFSLGRTLQDIAETGFFQAFGVTQSSVPQFDVVEYKSTDGCLGSLLHLCPLIVFA